MGLVSGIKPSLSFAGSIENKSEVKKRPIDKGTRGRESCPIKYAENRGIVLFSNS